ncbi:MAG TPA: sigma-70 family RNA polymerase sigma factor [Dongiaceae bacterium]|nr:sigma-70 family RNA polymerase sigma factor [Dongiaceae bacterium]
MEDHELLSEYAEHHSDQAFAELVARHIDLVYSTAFRLVGESHLSRDVSQMVFIDLARKPRSLRNPRVLAGWLYHTTRFKAASALRTEHRRRQWESTAMELSALDSDSQSVWQALAPQLDAAMDTLDLNDRDAVVLRFFKGKSLREVGRALGTSEDAAQKRVTRALEKLRSYFARQGIAATAGLIAAEISAHAVQSAPAGLAAGIAATSLAGAAGGGTWALKFVELMTATNLKITAAALLVIAAASTPILLGRHAASPEAPSAPGMVGTAQPDADPAPSLAVKPTEPPTSKESMLDRMVAESATDLTGEQIEAYLQRNKRSAENLLAAFRVSRDKKYLLEAAASFPTDPRVQFAAIATDAFPGEKRKWIDAFKASASENSLAWYFSALDYFKSKQPDLALRELSEATRREAFENYGAQTCQAVEEMCRLAGRSPLAAKFKAACGNRTPAGYLSELKALATEMSQVRQQYQDQGDAASANSMAAMSMALGGQLRANDVIEQLVGSAIQKKILAQLDPAGSYDFLGRPVSEVTGEIDRQKEATKQAMQKRDQVLPTLEEADLSSYFEREKLYGEVKAMQWLEATYWSANLPPPPSESN